MAAKYRPLKRDQSSELQRLADRIAALVKSGHDATLCDDLYSRLAADWQHVDRDLESTLHDLQGAILDRIGQGEDADAMLRLYMFHWRANVEVWEQKWKQEIEPPPPPSRGQKVAAFGAGAVAGHYGYRMAERMLADVFKPVGTLLRLFK